MTSQEQLNVHLKGAWHAMQVKTMEKSTAKALRGAWASWTHPKHSGWYTYLMFLPNSTDLNKTVKLRCNVNRDGSFVRYSISP